MSCTGVAASWCPECGTCTCVSPDDTIDGRPAEKLAEERWGWLQIRDSATGIIWRRWGIVESKLRLRSVTMLWEGNHWVDPACPLHGDDSKHAERPDLFDVLDEAASELEADGVLVSYEEFRRNLAFWED